MLPVWAARQNARNWRKRLGGQGLFGADGIASPVIGGIAIIENNDSKYLETCLIKCSASP
jgi:hypothetical protein